MDKDKDIPQKDNVQGHPSIVSSIERATSPNYSHNYGSGEYSDIPENINPHILKAEKLVSAIYLLTNLFTEEDPIRIRLRERSLDLVPAMSSGSSSPLDVSVYVKAIQLIDEILSYLAIALSINLISVMNYSILKEQFYLLRGQISTKGMETKKSLTIFPNYFYLTYTF